MRLGKTSKSNWSTSTYNHESNPISPNTQPNQSNRSHRPVLSSHQPSTHLNPHNQETSTNPKKELHPMRSQLQQLLQQQQQYPQSPKCGSPCTPHSNQHSKRTTTITESQNTPLQRNNNKSSMIIRKIFSPLPNTASPPPQSATKKSLINNNQSTRKITNQLNNSPSMIRISSSIKSSPKSSFLSNAERSSTIQTEGNQSPSQFASHSYHSKSFSNNFFANTFHQHKQDSLLNDPYPLTTTTPSTPTRSPHSHHLHRLLRNSKHNASIDVSIIPQSKPSSRSPSNECIEQQQQSPSSSLAAMVSSVTHMKSTKNTTTTTITPNRFARINSNKYSNSSSSMTNMLNGYYENTMNIMSVIENRKLGLTSSSVIPSNHLINTSTQIFAAAATTNPTTNGSNNNNLTQPSQFFTRNNSPPASLLHSNSSAFRIATTTTTGQSSRRGSHTQQSVSWKQTAQQQQQQDSEADGVNGGGVQDQLHELIIVTPQKEPVELISKSYITNLVHAETLEFFYCFVSVRHMPTPLRISFRTTVSKLRVFISKSTPFPSKFSHDDVLQSNEIRVDDEGKRKFSFEKLFLGVLSEAEQEVRIKIRFGISDKSSTTAHASSSIGSPMISSTLMTQFRQSSSDRNFNTEQSQFALYQQQQQQRIFNKPNKVSQISTIALAQDVAEILEKRRRKRMILKHGAEKDFQQENIKHADEGTIETVREQIEQRSNMMNSKIREVIEKKRIIDEQSFFKKECLMRCRDFQRVINQREQVKSKYSKQVAQFANTWGSLLLSVLGFHVFISKIKNELHTRKTMQSAFSLKRKVQKWKMRVNREQGDLFSRVLIQGALSIRFAVVSTFKSTGKQRAGTILTDLLKDKLQVDSVVNHLHAYLATINKISSKWREFRLKLHNFKSMLGYLFDKYFSTVLEQISKDSNDKTNYAEALNNARRIDKVKTEKSKNEFISYYLIRRRENYNENLYKYFMLMRKLHPKKFKVVQALLSKRYEQQELDFNEIAVPQERESEIENILFNQAIEKLRQESLKPPRYFVVPSFEVLKQIIKETFVKIQDANVVEKLREEQTRKNWPESTFLKKLILLASSEK